MSSISPDDIRWNDEARTKILEDSDRVLREAVLGVASTHADGSWEDAFAELNARLKDQFIDFEPGPDLRKYAEAIVAGEIDGAGGASASQESSDPGEGAADSGATDEASTGEERASDIAADAGASEPATPETDGSADEASTAAESAESTQSAETTESAETDDTSAGSGSEDPASGDASDGNEAPNETIDDPSDPTVTDEPSA